MNLDFIQNEQKRGSTQEQAKIQEKKDKNSETEGSFPFPSSSIQLNDKTKAGLNEYVKKFLMEKKEKKSK